MKKTLMTVLLLGGLFPVPGLHVADLAAAVKPTVEAAPNLPGVWAKVPARERLKILRVAELDGDRLLAERIFGLKVDADTSVSDLALENDEISGAIRATVKGAVTVGQAEYLEDGRVELVRAVKVEEVVETLNRVIKGKKLANGSIQTFSDKSETKRDVSRKTIDVTGNAAVPGSLGHGRILAKRAAEVDAYRRLAGRMMGVKISGESTVKDFCVKNDKLTAALSHTLKAATPTAIKYIAEESCEVTMEVQISEIIRTTRKFVESGVHKTVIKDSLQTRTLSETGSGAVRPDAKEPEQGENPFEETQTLIREVIRSELVVQ